MNNPAQPTRPPPPPRPAVSNAIGLASSLALHLAAVAYLGWAAATPDLALDFQLPTEVEFGLTEATTMRTPAPPPDPAAPSEAAADPSDPSEEAAVVADAGVEERPSDAGPTEHDPLDAGLAADDAGALVASADAGSPADAALAAGDGGTSLPAGAQLALRLHMARIRRSPLAEEAAQLLAVVPDWQIMLGDAAIDPLEDLERLLIAHPGTTNEWGGLLASRTLVAGEHTHDEAFVRAAVDRMAAARGTDAPWADRLGVPVAPWHDRSTTPRVLALIGPRQFTVTRPDDLPRLLAVAEARRAERHGDGGTAHSEAWADALLSMEKEQEALSIEIEGARQFVRGGRTDLWPTRGRAAMSYLTDGGRARLGLAGSAHYESPEQAGKARDYWDRVRRAYADNSLVGLLGLSGVLTEAELTVEDDTVRFRTELGLSQARLILSYGQSFLERHQRRRGRTAPRTGSSGPERGSDAPKPSP